MMAAWKNGKKQEAIIKTNSHSPGTLSVKRRVSQGKLGNIQNESHVTVITTGGGHK